MRINFVEYNEIGSCNSCDAQNYLSVPFLKPDQTDVVTLYKLLISNFATLLCWHCAMQVSKIIPEELERSTRPSE